MSVLADIYDFCNSFVSRFGGEVGVIGKSELGRAIPYIALGNGDRTAIFQYGIHAREYVTSFLCIYQVKNAKVVEGIKLYFIPCANPDGVELCQNGLSSVSDFRLREYLKGINGGEDFSLWKANARAVDLNQNFPAKWGKGALNTLYPSSGGYIGEYPLCASECRALADFTLKVKPRVTVSYHAKGEEIYWRFGNTLPRYSADYAEAAVRATGYRLADAPLSVGGYKDWCIEQGIPSLTIEVGADSLTHPIGAEHLGEIYAANINMVSAITEVIKSERN